jgi:UDP-N-acetylmuramyl pentapeptide phosphotransferase/UDP-N-acetylglucosamine-1-phosphate transferase
MLGDTGSNVLGAAVGLAAVLVLDHPATLVVLVVLAVLNGVSEWVSFSEVIDRTPPLRWLDRLGSRRRSY